MSNEYPVDEQLDTVKAAHGISTQLSELIGHHMQREMQAGRFVKDNESLRRVCQHMEGLEAALSEMVVDLKKANAILVRDAEAASVTESAIKKAAPKPTNNLPF